ELRQRHLCYAILGLRIWDPHDRVQKIDVLLVHRGELFVDPKACLGDDLNGVLQIRRRGGCDALLLRPGYVMRTEQPLHLDGEFDTPTRIRREHPFADGHVQHATQDTKLLVDGRWLDHALYDHARSCLSLHACAKTPPEISL